LNEIAIRGEYITLGQLLKLVGEVRSGGTAKDYLIDETPLVNGEPEKRRGRKLRPGDTVELRYEGKLLLTAA
jgi:ribosome-associated protein